MKGSDLFDAMNDLPADVIASAEASPEALDAGRYGITKRQRRHEAFTRFTTNGWVIAAVSLIVAFGVVALIVRAGRTSPGITPSAGSAGNGQFTFSYELPDGNTYTAGESIRMTASVTNHGEPFAYTGGSGDFVPHAELRTSAGQRLVFSAPLVEDWGTFTVAVGQTGSNSGYTLTLPDDIPAGDCDLILSYGTASVTFSGAVQVTDKAGSFTFSYAFPDKKNAATFLQTDTLRVNVSMTYKGLPRPVQTSSSGPMPSARFIHQTTGFILPISCLTPTDVVTSFLTPGKTYTMPGELYGIPETAPAGVYDLVVSYGDSSKTFKAALTLVAAGQKTVENYTFGYQMERTIFEPGETFNLITYLTNNGHAFPMQGRSSDLAPEAYLVIRYVPETSGSGEVVEYRLTAGRTPSDDAYGSFTFDEGQTGTGYLFFTIPKDAPVGLYEMDFMFRGVTCVFPARVEVAADVNHPMRDSAEEFETRVTEPRYDDDFIGEGTNGLRFADCPHFIQCVQLVGHEPDAERLAEIRIPMEADDRITASIGVRAFDGCSALKTLYVPKGVGFIEDGAFIGCPHLTEIRYQGYQKDWIGMAVESPAWNAGLADAVTVVCRDGTLTYPPITYDGPGTEPEETRPGEPLSDPDVIRACDSPVWLCTLTDVYSLPGRVTARTYYNEQLGAWETMQAEIDLSMMAESFGADLPTVSLRAGSLLDGRLGGQKPTDKDSFNSWMSSRYEKDSGVELPDPDVFNADFTPRGSMPLDTVPSLPVGIYYLAFRITAGSEEYLYLCRILVG